VKGIRSASEQASFPATTTKPPEPTGLSRLRHFTRRLRRLATESSLVLGLAVIAACGCRREAVSDRAHVGPREGIENAIGELAQGEQDGFLTVSHGDTEGLVNVGYFPASGNRERMYVQVEYPFAERPEDVLGAAGIDVPAGWRIDEFEKGVSVQYAVPYEKRAAIGGFLCEVFTKLYKVDLARGVEIGTDCM